MWMSLIGGADFSSRGTSFSEVLENTSVNWPLNSSACSVSDSAKPLPFLLLRGGIPWLSFLWLLVYRWKSLGLTLMSPTKLLTYKSCCFLISALICCLSSWNLDLSLLLLDVFAFAWILFLFRIFLLISDVIQGTEATDLLVLEGMYLSTASCMKEVIKLKFSWTEREPEWPLKYLSFAKFEESRLIESKSPFWYKQTWCRGFFLGGMKAFKVPATMSWSLSLSGECTSWNCPGNEVKIKSSVFSSRVGKFTSCSNPWSFIMSTSTCPSAWLSMVPFLLSRSGQTMSLKLKSPSMWTEGSFLCWVLMCSSWFRRSWKSSKEPLGFRYQLAM